MFKDGKAQRNASGKVTKAASYQSRDKPNARIEPNRKWFTNTRVIAQDNLTKFREAVAKTQSDPYSYLLKQNKLPMSLIRDDNTKNGVKIHQAKVAVETSPFSDTFGPKAQRKRVKLGISSLQDLAGHSIKMHDDYLDRKEHAELLSGRSGEAEAGGETAAEVEQELTTAREPIFSKGQSKRIWNELYKVIDSSDVVLHVLDARDPEGTRCRSVEKYIREEAPHKHLLFVLNKCDLIPTSVAVSLEFSSLSSSFTLLGTTFGSQFPLLSQDTFRIRVHSTMEVRLLQLWYIDLEPAACLAVPARWAEHASSWQMFDRARFVPFELSTFARCSLTAGLVEVLLVTPQTFPSHASWLYILVFDQETFY